MFCSQLRKVEAYVMLSAYTTDSNRIVAIESQVNWMIFMHKRLWNIHVRRLNAIS